jgi:hypothetical protein
MCGAAGVFVGCAALAACPRRPARDAESAAGAGPAGGAYRSPFLGWDARASVRTAPRRVFSAADAAAAPISPDLVPVAAHPQVRALAPAQFRTVLLQHLYRYLRFTVALESLVVNRAVLGIASGSVGVRLSRQMRADAYKIYCDEAYHALFSADLLQQIEDVTGQRARPSEQPYVLDRLSAALAQVDVAWRPLAELLFVIVSETLISATLSDHLRAQDMAPSVRDCIHDHAVDEGRHHAYFAGFLRVLWPQLSRAEQRFAGRLVPDLVAIFLDPDLDGIRADLTDCGMTAQQAQDVLADCFAPARLQEQRQAMARQTLLYFDELGAFTDGRPQELLRERRLSVG